MEWPTKPPPRVGSPARIQHFGGRAEQVRVVAIEGGGRTVVVEDRHGQRRAFTLRRATAAYVLAGEQHSPRLRL